jgi:hypothetical protein
MALQAIPQRLPLQAVALHGWVAHLHSILLRENPSVAKGVFHGAGGCAPEHVSRLLRQRRVASDRFKAMLESSTAPGLHIIHFQTARERRFPVMWSFEVCYASFTALGKHETMHACVIPEGCTAGENILRHYT